MGKLGSRVLDTSPKPTSTKERVSVIHYSKMERKFHDIDMKNVSFLKTDISTVTFGKVRWGEEKKIRDERNLEEYFKNPDMPALKDFSKKLLWIVSRQFTQMLEKIMNIDLDMTRLATSSLERWN